MHCNNWLYISYISDCTISRSRDCDVRDFLDFETTTRSSIFGAVNVFTAPNDYSVQGVFQIRFSASCFLSFLISNFHMDLTVHFSFKSQCNNRAMCYIAR